MTLNPIFNKLLETDFHSYYNIKFTNNGEIVW